MYQCRSYLVWLVLHGDPFLHALVITSLDLFLRNPGKEVAKQCSTEHDHLIHEFEKLTTDLDGLLGVLEDSLQECSGSEANFEAKELLCALFQVYIYVTVNAKLPF